MSFGRRQKTGDRGGGPVDRNGEQLTNSALVEAMHNVAVSDTAGSRALLYRLMLDSTLVVATPEPLWTGTRTTKEGERLSLVTLTTSDGTALPVFTSLRTLLEWRQGGGYAALDASGLFEMAEWNGTEQIVIDPGSTPSGIITRSEIGALARGRLSLGPHEVVAAETEIRIGLPDPPAYDALVAALREACAGTPAVRVAWLYLMQQDKARPEMSVGVVFIDSCDDDDTRSIAMRSLIDLAHELEPRVADLVFMEPGDQLQQSLEHGAGTELFRR